MRSELVVLIKVGFLIYNTYYDGKFTSMIYKNKKYMQMAFYAFVGIALFVLLRTNPTRGKAMLVQANDAIKYMPLDKQSASILSPILDFTTRDTSSHFMGNVNPQTGNHRTMEQRILSSGNTPGKKVKRSVSETKKKYVASLQGWKCNLM